MTVAAVASLVGRGLIELTALGLAYLNLRQADKLRMEEKYSWSRHFLVIANIWAAALAIIGVIIFGNIK